MSVNKFDTQLAKQIASELLAIEAIKINLENPYTWASGWKSPIYCDNRLSLSFPSTRTLIKESLAKLIKEKYPNAEAIAGVATAGIPQGALVADYLDLPFIYIRSKSKAHGLENQVEGLTRPDQKVVILEDLVSTGGSSLQASEAIRAAHMEVLGMVSIFTYGFPISVENFKSHNIDLWYLSDYNTMIDLGMENGSLIEDQLATLKAWRTNPAQWGNEVEETA
ncbi:orotate phosphoribosyltransferase [Marinoscillum sp. MHG1-6]|uniref:orotate phosphoribosyltransferase n=1 Tax=Marinoscillum sp. MHG1-6 TaxID=2959627 RepID=UPI00215762AC|nr:orotate phosphoribosyltransferase [Marinoscillum sp. MHG1-6]